MCKIFAMPGITPDKYDRAFQLVKAMQKGMSRGNSDGFGYAAVSPDNKVFGERWLRNDDAFGARLILKPEMEPLIKRYGHTLHIPLLYNHFGARTETFKAIAMHTRLATNTVNLANTHPFVRESVALIHNGIIRNDSDFPKLVSTCDSEAILSQYLKHGVRGNAAEINKVAADLKGGYAVMAMVQNKDRTFLDIFKNDSTSLCTIYMPEFQQFIYTTDATVLFAAAKEIETPHGVAFHIKGGSFYRIDVDSGELITRLTFDTRDKDSRTHWTPHYGERTDMDHANAIYQNASLINRHPPTLYKPTVLPNNSASTNKSGEDDMISEKDIQELVQKWGVH